LHGALERMMADLVFGPELAVDDRASLLARIERSGVPEPDRDALLASDLSRLLVYRKLVRANLRDAMFSSIPRTMSRLGPLFDEYFDRFLADCAPQTHYLRDVTVELLDFCAPLWPEDPRVPDWAMDLARHEAVQIEVGAKAGGAHDEGTGALELDAPVQFIEAVRLMRYGWAVHLLSEDLDDRTVPEPRRTDLFVYRSPEHEVRYLELTPLAAAILERLLAGQALGASIREACAALTVEVDEAVIQGSARVLADLGERGALIGKREDQRA